MMRGAAVSFRNFSQLKIRGYVRSADTTDTMTVFFFGKDKEFLCLDAEHGKKLLSFGIGASVNLYNVKVSSTNAMLITASSGIRKTAVEEKKLEKTHLLLPASILTPPPPITRQMVQPRSDKWNCLLCNFANFASTSVCFSCQMDRRHGPVGPLSLFKHLKGPPYTYITWTCDMCFARKNSHWCDSCWKCLEPRSKRSKKLKLKKKVKGEALKT